MCEYCEGDGFQQEYDFEISVESYFLKVRHNCLECENISEENFLINYCPYCGKKL